MICKFTKKSIKKIALLWTYTLTLTCRYLNCTNSNKRGYLFGDGLLFFISMSQFSPSGVTKWINPSSRGVRTGSTVYSTIILFQYPLSLIARLWAWPALRVVILSSWRDLMSFGTHSSVLLSPIGNCEVGLQKTNKTITTPALEFSSRHAALQVWGFT